MTLPALHLFALLPDFGGLDFSPVVVLLLIYVLRILLWGVYAEIAPRMA